jgi:probable rRNA maturation factor
MPRAALPPLQLSLQFADARHRPLLPRHRVARWIRAALAAPAQIAVRLVDAEEGLVLNRDYRGQDHATNVLTFAYGAPGEPGEPGEPGQGDPGDPGDAAMGEAPPLMADLVLCAPVIEAEARAAGRPLAAHYAHLLVHGTLHAQGWDHQDDDQAQAMEARESAILARLGMADPHARAPARVRAKPAGAKPAVRSAVPTPARSARRAR